MLKFTSIPPFVNEILINFDCRYGMTKIGHDFWGLLKIAQTLWILNRWHIFMLVLHLKFGQLVFTIWGKTSTKKALRNDRYGMIFEHSMQNFIEILSYQIYCVVVIKKWWNCSLKMLMIIWQSWSLIFHTSFVNFISNWENLRGKHQNDVKLHNGKFQSNSR